eukprot:1017240-Rhodomonas_salina.2
MPPRIAGTMPEGMELPVKPVMVIVDVAARAIGEPNVTVTHSRDCIEGAENPFNAAPSTSPVISVDAIAMDPGQDSAWPAAVGLEHPGPPDAATEGITEDPWGVSGFWSTNWMV